MSHCKPGERVWGHAAPYLVEPVKNIPNFLDVRLLLTFIATVSGSDKRFHVDHFLVW